MCAANNAGPRVSTLCVLPAMHMHRTSACREDPFMHAWRQPHHSSTQVKSTESSSRKAALHCTKCEMESAAAAVQAPPEKGGKSSGPALWPYVATAVLSGAATAAVLWGTGVLFTGVAAALLPDSRVTALAAPFRLY